MKSLKIENKGVFFIAVSQFGVAFSFHCIFAFIPFYILKVSPFGPRRPLIWTGMIMGASNIVASFTASFWGGLTSRFRPKLLFERGMVLNGILILLMGLTSNLYLLLLPENHAGVPRRRINHRAHPDFLSFLQGTTSQGYQPLPEFDYSGSIAQSSCRGLCGFPIWFQVPFILAFSSLRSPPSFATVMWVTFPFRGRNSNLRRPLIRGCFWVGPYVLSQRSTSRFFQASCQRF